MKTAVILCAGKGTKMWPYAKLRPKSLIPVSNQPLLLHQISLLKALGCKQIIIALNQHEQSYQHLLRNENGVELVQVGETDGNAQTILFCFDKIETDRFLVLYGDVWLEKEDLKKLLGSNETAALLQAHQETSRNYIGCRLNEDKTIKEIIGHSRSQTTHHFLGFSLDRSIHEFLKNVAPIFPSVEVGMMPPQELFLEAALVDWIKRGNSVNGITCSYPSFDLDKPWHILQSNLYSNRKICGNLKANELGQGASIDPSASVSGFVRLGNNSKVGKNVVIEGNIWVGDNTEIKAGAILKGNNVIGDNCEIGYYCFVEEGSTIGHRCKVLHAAELSGVILDGVYLYHYMEIAGMVGENTDIGAGTVCGSLRFDDSLSIQNVAGRKEIVEGQEFANACYIGDFARTGVNSILLPGVKTGARSIVGPGVVLSDDLEDGKIIFLKQETVKKDWGPEKYGW
jgi:UDP-N-acetylglucosamine diphosphorylase / glucose-1-phosphate thymidylyltransferase / UDP-N-acetylgalactosamine diphosphorylase / glucosamine-1-phosphate N-acetyltransferase / galactosamine-1-phosphate N-acetyltransferase